MANEGDKKAISKLTEINTMITDDEKYSSVENAVIEFYKANCPLYFNRFVEDIEYLKNCRNKCAHLKVNDNSLYVPSDYHARMLICSMYDNILSVKAPFIMDLFSFAQADIEHYSTQITYIPNDGLDESIVAALKEKYLKRMTYDSIKKSYKTFIRLLFVSDNEECEKNIYGLYAFTFALSSHVIKNGYTQLFDEADVQQIFTRIEIEFILGSEPRRNALIALMVRFPVIMDMIRTNFESLFEGLSKRVLLNPRGLDMYRVFYPRDEKSTYAFFLENDQLKDSCFIETLYKNLKDCDDFDFSGFMKEMVSHIPTFNAFHDADVYMGFFKSHLEEMSNVDIEEVLKIYRGNIQCTNRNRHSTDMTEIRKYLDEHQETETD